MMTKGSGNTQLMCTDSRGQLRPSPNHTGKKGFPSNSNQSQPPLTVSIRYEKFTALNKCALLQKGRALSLSGDNDAHGAARGKASWAVKANRNSQPIKPSLLCEQRPVTKDSDAVPLC